MTGAVLTSGAHSFRAAFFLDLIREVRNVWQFYRDRRPEAYKELIRR